ncbi:MAG: PadR family transcriptional regulator PadR [Verrucomicrobiales bacterium]|jgi:PadR family transcriptional regulator PadR
MPSKDLVAASARPLLLSILAEGENYGYAIIQQVKVLSGGVLQWTDGMLYPVLHRLENEGLIVSEWKIPESGRKRKYYKLKPDGKKALALDRADWIAVDATLKKAWNPSTAQFAAI